MLLYYAFLKSKFPSFGRTIVAAAFDENASNSEEVKPKVMLVSRH